jgi:hypothetical protein
MGYLLCCLQGNPKAVGTNELVCPYKAVLQYSTKQKDWGLTDLSFLEHQDCGGMAKPTTAELFLLQTSHTAVQANRGAKAKELQDLWRSKDQIQVSKHTAYRVRDMITGQSDGLYEPEYELVEPYLKELQNLNPGTTIDVQRDAEDETKFLRCFYSLGAVTKVAASSCISVVQLDAAHMKHRKYNGIVMVLEGVQQ